jgi:hypothetical protein
MNEMTAILQGHFTYEFNQVSMAGSARSLPIFPVRAGLKIDHITPRKRRDVAA